MAYPYITTTEQLRLLLPTTADVNDVVLEQLQSYFDRAENELLRPWLGQPTLDELAEPSPARAPQVAALVKLLTPAVALYGYRDYAPKAQLLLTMNGPRRETSGDQKPLTPAELASLQADLERSARAQLDQALVYLESQPVAFATWHASTWCTIAPYRFFRTADVLDRYTTGDMTRARFRKLWPDMNAAELLIRQVLGRPLLQRLLAEQDQLAHREVIDLVRTAIVGQVMLDDDVAHEAGCTALQELKFLLNLPDSLLQYPEFTSSPEYQAPYKATDQSNAFYNGIAFG